jgi:hypothetical protein
VLFVGHLSDRMLKPQVRDAVVGVETIAQRRRRAMQRHLTRIGLYKDKLDGKAGARPRWGHQSPPG